jgi:hypothetical protein
MRSQTGRGRVARRQDRRQRRRVAGLTAVFDLGASGQSDIAKEKDSMLGKAFVRLRRKRRG